MVSVKWEGDYKQMEIFQWNIFPSAHTNLVKIKHFFWKNNVFNKSLYKKKNWRNIEHFEMVCFSLSWLEYYLIFHCPFQCCLTQNQENPEYCLRWPITVWYNSTWKYLNWFKVSFVLQDFILWNEIKFENKQFPLKEKEWSYVEFSLERGCPELLVFSGGWGVVWCGVDKALRYHQDHQCSILEQPVTSSGIRNFLHSARPVSSYFHEVASAAIPLCMLGWRPPEKGFTWFCALFVHQGMMFLSCLTMWNTQPRR